MNSKPGIKIVSIKLQSPSKRKKSQSPPKPPYKQSIQKLKQLQPDRNKIFQQMRRLQQSKMTELENTKQAEKMKKQEIKRDRQTTRELTKSQLSICQNLFSTLIGENQQRQFTVQSDLRNIKKEELKGIIQVVYFRKQKNYIFDFLFALWDSQRLGLLQNYYQSNF